MKPLIKCVLILTFATVGFFSRATDAVNPRGGMPLPWPFPWAKECPVDWASLTGRYLMSDTSNQEQIDLKITVSSFLGRRVLHIARYNRFGELVGNGFSVVSLNQRMLRLKLWANRPYEEEVWALVKLHYLDSHRGCSADHLVLILTLEGANSSSNITSHYRLVKISPDSQVH